MPTAAEPVTAPRPGRLLPLVLAALIGLLAGDAMRPAQSQAGARAAVAAIDAYRATASKWLGQTGLVRCRFTPTCSAYGREAITRYGLVRGGAMATARIVRCNPWAKGGVDPVP
jgi:putative membrane protein insertion efficiency factor